jgi:hypothetical protein
MIWMIIALKKDENEEEDKSSDWISTFLPIYIFLILGLVFLAFILRVVRKLIWISRLNRRQKHFEECIEVYNECAIAEKKYTFRTTED